MLAYAAETRPAGRAGSPKALVLILAGHAVLLAAVLTAKMEFTPGTPFKPIDIFDVRNPPPPPPPPEDTKPETDPKPTERAIQETVIDRTPPIIKMEHPTTINVDTGQTIRDIGDVIGSGPTTILDPPRHSPVKLGPRLATSEGALKPPYPLSKARAEEEATLRLRLSIDARGRVVAVEPVGTADPVFLESARRHILRSWRYKPATEDGAAMPSSTVITLSFRLEDA
jgi:protein TonB